MYGVGLGVFLSALRLPTPCSAATTSSCAATSGATLRQPRSAGSRVVLPDCPGSFVTIWCSMRGWDKLRQRATYQPFILAMQVGDDRLPAVRRAECRARRRWHALRTVRGAGCDRRVRALPAHEQRPVPRRDERVAHRVGIGAAEPVAVIRLLSFHPAQIRHPRVQPRRRRDELRREERQCRAADQDRARHARAGGPKRNSRRGARRTRPRSSPARCRCRTRASSRRAQRVGLERGDHHHRVGEAAGIHPHTIPKPSARGTLVTGKQPPAERRDAAARAGAPMRAPGSRNVPKATSAAATQRHGRQRAQALADRIDVEPADENAENAAEERAGDRVRNDASRPGRRRAARRARWPSAPFAGGEAQRAEMPPHITRQCPLAAKPRSNAAPSVRPPVMATAPDRRLRKSRAARGSASSSGSSAGDSMSSNCPWSIAQNKRDAGADAG